MTINSTIKLATDQDWITWFKTLKTIAMNEDLWDYLDPTKPNKPPLTSTAPIPPDITSFRKRQPSGTRAATAETISVSTQSTDTITARTDDEDPTFQEGDDIAIQAQQLAELTEKGLRMYNAMWTNYEHLNKRHKDFKTRSKTVQNWVLETVDEPLSRHHCPAEKSLPEWIQSIYDEFSLAEDERKQKARRVYREILAEPYRTKITTYKAAGDWLTRWRNAINEARDVNLQEAIEPDQWLTDLTTALRASPLESWINAYSVTQISQVRAGTLAIGPVTADIRRVIGNQPEFLKRPKVVPGAFHTRDGAEEGDDDASASGRRLNSRKRLRKSIGDDKESRCPACNLFHPLARCYYAFPEKMPQGFRLVNHIINRVKQRIEKNEDNVADRIRKIKLEGSA